MNEAEPPAQIPAFAGLLVISTAMQLEETSTVTVKVLPMHVPVAGVTVYTAVPVPVGIVSVPLILAAPVVCATPPVTPPLMTGAGHVYVVPIGVPEGVTVKVCPELMEVV
jgi:hypothetical protein